MLAPTEKPRASRRRLWMRFVLAGPVAIIVALTLLAGMPLWLPGGAAGIDNLAVPLALAPLIWAGLFFHACLDRSLARIALVAAALFLVHGGLVASRMIATVPTAEKAK
ncbi:hypothetical protein [Sphingobium boeckii]|uniref:Uncharacterized protein n=1 Tax=Sphingobium boeckii TaxID=1082345 RepID=A0A7W9ALG7_9SPHN|nr:hypothetical protein [Sphingobium boeckii]MBB5687676.1 hypothetical protein [Sphingobium boeckii]